MENANTRSSEVAEFVTKRTVPLYLFESKFLETWDDSDDVVEVNPTVLKPDLIVSSDQQLLHLLTTLKFWIVEDIPISIITYVLTARTSECQAVLKPFARDWSCVNALLEIVQSTDRWQRALDLGNVRCIEFLHQNGESRTEPHSCSSVARAGWIDCLTFMHRNGFAWDATTCSSAAENGHFDCLVYLHENGCPWDTNTVFQSARGGHVQCLVYALTQGFAWNNHAAYIAAAKGHVSCLNVFVHGKSAPAFLAKLSQIGAAHGQLCVLQYLRPLDCQWDARVVIYATKAGSLDCLKYLHEQDLFNFSEAVTCLACLHGHLECLKFAVEVGCHLTSNALVYCTLERKSHYAIVAYLATLGFWEDYEDPDAENDDDDPHAIEFGSDEYWGLHHYTPTPAKP